MHNTKADKLAQSSWAERKLSKARVFNNRCQQATKERREEERETEGESKIEDAEIQKKGAAPAAGGTPSRPLQLQNCTLNRL